MSIFNNIKALYKTSVTNTDSIEELIKSSKRQLKIVGILGGIILILALITIGLAVNSHIEYKSLKESIDNEFGPQFTSKKVFMAVDIKTANIRAYESGLLTTDIGVVELSRRPKSTIIILFTDLEGKLQPIEVINKSNELNSSTFEYIGSDYDPGEGSTLINTEYDRLRYKDYLSEAENLNILKTEYNIKFGIAMAISVFTLMIVSLFFTLLIGIRKLNGEHYIPAIALFSTREKQKETIKIEKRGIGAVSEEIENEAYERTEEDAIASEGGQFKGKITKR